MTAAHEHRLSDRRRLRLQSLCTMRGHKLTGFRRKQWMDVQMVVCSQMQESLFSAPVFAHFDASEIADRWKRHCQSVGIGVIVIPFIGRVANLLFWRFFLPILIELAKEWLADMQTDTISGVAVGSSEGRV